MISGVRTQLLETEDHVCPTCGTPDVSPDSLIPNQSLRKAANTFQNDSSKQQMPAHAQPSVSVSLKSSQSSRPAAPTITVPASRPAVVPRGPSVLDYKPPPKPPTPPVAAVPQRSAQPVPTLPEPAPLPIQTVSGGPTPLQMSSSETYNRLVHLLYVMVQYDVLKLNSCPAE